MAYSELIKNFNKIRDYMRDFYVYGFKSRSEYDAKSARSYDNERRRIESWLGDYMSFRQDASGKRMFISVDSRSISENPFYKAFKAKSFTDNDIILHFYILDLLSTNENLTVREMTDMIADRLAGFAEDRIPDESTIRKKLKEYDSMGIIKDVKCGREKTYELSKDDVDMEAWKDAIGFFSEAGPLGVVGSYLRDKYEDQNESVFRFKHHYILQALDSEVFYSCILAIGEHRSVDLVVYSKKKKHIREHRVLPIKVHISTQNGRYYVCAWDQGIEQMIMLRLDNIKKISIGPVVTYAQDIMEKYDDFVGHMWGTSSGESDNLEHLEMTIHVERDESFIVNRLVREARQGNLECLDDNTYMFSIDVFDAAELLPWVRTFTGRIISLKSSNQKVEDRFYDDMATMFEIYGGDENAV